MDNRHVLIILGLLGVGGYYYLHKTNTVPKILSTFSTKPGYTSMMKIHPAYYNSTSMEGNAMATQTFGDTGPLSTWVLPAEQGNGMAINPGWTSYPDAYAARVGASWLAQAQEVRL